jgi:hypothetical protein
MQRKKMYKKTNPKAMVVGLEALDVPQPHQDTATAILEVATNHAGPSGTQEVMAASTRMKPPNS